MAEDGHELREADAEMDALNIAPGLPQRMAAIVAFKIDRLTPTFHKHI